MKVIKEPSEGISLEDILCEVSGLPLVFMRVEDTPSFRICRFVLRGDVIDIGFDVSTGPTSVTRLARVAWMGGVCLVVVPGVGWDPRDVARRIAALCPHRETL